MDRIACMHCGRDFIPNPRVKNQQYCKLQSVNKPGRPFGNGGSWRRIRPIKITNGIAEKAGGNATPSIGANTGNSIGLLGKGIGCSKESAMRNGVRPAGPPGR